MSEVLISAADVSSMMKSALVVIIDTRNPDAYAAGHIPGAVNMHEIFTYLATSTPEGIEELKSKFAEAFGAAGLSGKETAIVYEQSMNTGFGQSCRGYYLLGVLGYPDAKVLHGGFDAWTAAGLPVTTAPAAPSPASFPVDPAGASILIDAKTMLAALDKPDVAILDVRDVDEWIADSSSPYKNAGVKDVRMYFGSWNEWSRDPALPIESGSPFKAAA